MSNDGKAALTPSKSVNRRTRRIHYAMGFLLLALMAFALYRDGTGRPGVVGLTGVTALMCFAAGYYSNHQFPTIKLRRTDCPQCGARRHRRVSEDDSLAPDRDAYRICLACGTPYRPALRGQLPETALPLSLLLLLAFGALAAMTVRGATLAGAIGIISLLVCAVGLLFHAWSLVVYRPSQPLTLLPQISGAMSSALKQWLEEQRPGGWAIADGARRFVGLLLIGLGWILLSLGLVCAMSFITVSHGYVSGFAIAVMVFVGAPICGGLGSLSYKLGRSLNARRAGQVLGRDRRPPILLLRSFEDDEILLPELRDASVEQFAPHVRTRQSLNTLENSLVNSFGHIGPVIAIGAPGQMLPPSGAARAWFPHTDWQGRIADLLQWAQRVILVLGDVERHGLAWEVEYIFRHVAIQKVVLVLPPHVAGPNNQARWQFLQSLTQNALPPYRPGTFAVYFPLPATMLRISLSEHAELVTIDRKQLSMSYKAVFLCARDFAQTANSDAVVQVLEKDTSIRNLSLEKFPWPYKFQE